MRSSQKSDGQDLIDRLEERVSKQAWCGTEVEVLSRYSEEVLTAQVGMASGFIEQRTQQLGSGTAADDCSGDESRITSSVVWGSSSGSGCACEQGRESELQARSEWCRACR